MNSITILETNVLHTSDILYWLNGSSAESVADTTRIPHVLQLQLTNKPSDLQLRHSAGKTALWRKPTTPIVNGVADDIDKTFVPGTDFPLSGIVSDPRGFFNPRTFSITVGSSDVPIPGQPLLLYPTPLGTQFGTGGGLIATLRYAANGDIVPWALLTVEVTVPGGGTQAYRAQADHRGDVMISLQRLPPLPEGISEYNAQISVQAMLGADPQVPLSTDDLVAMGLESLTIPASFSDPIRFQAVPGEIQLIRSASKDHLAVQPN